MLLLFLLMPALALANFTLSYLQQYGYLQKEALTGDIESALKLLQETYGLPVDGIINNETLEFIGKHRCGNKDHLLPFTANPNNKWINNTVTWYLYGNQPPVSLVQAAFTLWEKYANLKFYRTNRSPNIIISYSPRQHMSFSDHSDCAYDFDGPGHVLAHAFIPTLASTVVDIHIDQEENWDYTMDLPESGKPSFFLCILHEIGHAIGLKHSYVNTSIMFSVPLTPRGINNLNEYELDQDDIRAIQYLYGKPLTTSTTTTTTTSTTTSTTSTTTITAIEPHTLTKLDICSLRLYINTFIVVKNRIYVFHGQYVWILSLDPEHRLPENYTQPKVITDWLTFLPATFTHVSAIYQRPNGEIVLFTDKEVYVFQYPSLQFIRKQSLASFGVRMGTVSGALISSTGNSYLFTDKWYVMQINECISRAHLLGYIQDVFAGVPNSLKGVFRYINGNLYFITDSNVLEFNEFTGTVTKSESDAFEILKISCIRDTLLSKLYDVLRFFQ